MKFKPSLLIMAALISGQVSGKKLDALAIKEGLTLVDQGYLCTSEQQEALYTIFQQHPLIKILDSEEDQKDAYEWFNSPDNACVLRLKNPTLLQHLKQWEQMKPVLERFKELYPIVKTYFFHQAEMFVPTQYLKPVVDMIEATQNLEVKTIFQNIFIAHATANPFSDESPFYQFQDKNKLIEDMKKLSMLITPESSYILFDYLSIIAAFGGTSVLQDSDRSLQFNLEKRRREYEFFLKEIREIEKTPVNFLALCVKMGALLYEDGISRGSIATPPFDGPLAKITREFNRTHVNLNDFTKFFITQSQSEGTLFQREFASIHGISRYFPDFIPLPFMGDLDAGDIVRATPNGDHKLWLTGVPIHPAVRQTITLQNTMVNNTFYSSVEASLYMNGCYGDGDFMYPALFILHDWFHLTIFASSFYIEQKSTTVEEIQQHRSDNLHMVKMIQEWMDIPNPDIDPKLKEFMAFYLTHEEAVCDPLYDIFNNNLRYSKFYAASYVNQHLIDPHYYAPLLPTETLDRLRASQQQKISIFDPIYNDLKMFVGAKFPVKIGYVSSFMMGIHSMYEADFGRGKAVDIQFTDSDSQPFLSNDILVSREFALKEKDGQEIEIDPPHANGEILKACTDNQYWKIGLLIAHGADINLVYENKTLVQRAIESGSYRTAYELVLRGASCTKEQLALLRSHL